MENRQLKRMDLQAILAEAAHWGSKIREAATS